MTTNEAALLTPYPSQISEFGDTEPKAVVRNYRDSVFRMLFSDKNALLNLYNALRGTAYTDPDELVINTLENAIYLGRRNDISFVIHDQMYLYEHQSTVNPNMPLRNLIYIASLYNKQLINHNIYSSHRIMLTPPHFITFYNGIEEQPERVVMRLSASFEQGEGPAFESDGEGPDLELKVLQININRGFNEELMQSCRELQGYMIYVDRVRDYAQTMPLYEAVNRAVDECIAEDILADFLARNRAEVVMNILYEYDQERHYRMIAEEEKKYGREEGRIEGAALAVLGLLDDIEAVPEGLREKISAEKDIDTLIRWSKVAARVKTLEEFVEKM